MPVCNVVWSRFDSTDGITCMLHIILLSCFSTLNHVLYSVMHWSHPTNNALCLEGAIFQPCCARRLAMHGYGAQHAIGV